MYIIKNFSLIANIFKKSKIGRLKTSFLHFFKFYIKTKNKSINNNFLQNWKSIIFFCVITKLKYYKKKTSYTRIRKKIEINNDKKYKLKINYNYEVYANKMIVKLLNLYYLIFFKKL